LRAATLPAEHPQESSTPFIFSIIDMSAEYNDNTTFFFRIEARLDELAKSVADLSETISHQNESSGSDNVLVYPTSATPNSHELAGHHQREGLPKRPSLPDPRLIRRIIQQRRLRDRYFGSEIFGDPAWDMLLDLAVARVEYKRVSVTSLCIASSVPPTTALRWISEMVKSGLLQRTEDETDRRRAFISLTDKAADTLARYFSEIGPAARIMV
jgi:predicted transcriptional regulator